MWGNKNLEREKGKNFATLWPPTIKYDEERRKNKRFALPFILINFCLLPSKAFKNFGYIFSFFCCVRILQHWFDSFQYLLKRNRIFFLTINPLGYILYDTPIHCCCMYFHKAIFRTNSPEFHLFFLKKIFSYIDRVSPWCPSRATGWFLAGFFVVDEAIWNASISREL